MQRIGLIAAVVVLAAAAAFLLRREAPPLPPLCFVSEESGTPQVHVLAGGVEAALTRGPRAHFPFGMAGDALLVVESEGEGDAHVERLLLVARDGGARELHGETRRTRSPVFIDGAVVLESSRDGFSDLWRLPLDGGAGTQLTHDAEGCFEPQPAPGGLVYVSSREGQPDLYVLDGGRLTSNPAEDVAPRVSPEGARVVFVSSRGGSDALYLLPGERPLHAAPLDPGPKAASAGREDVERDAEWTRDGREVVFAARSGGGRLRLWAVEAATGKARALTDGQQEDDQPALSPDGALVAFSRGEAGRSQLAVVPLQGGDVRVLTSGPAARWLPRWCW